MSEIILQQIIQQTETLNLDEQLQLAAHLEKLIQQHDPKEIIHYRWLKIQNYREKIFQLAEKYGASNLRVLGIGESAKNNQSAEVNFLVQFDSSRSLLDQSGLMMELRELLGYELYVTSEGGLKGEYGERVLKEAVPL